ncbi:hypothetical protein IMY05_C4635000500 [Salix suchowensis]|nr:hypothetical protein IMY05_C4635000500 [Salix suchowensis]
MPGHYAHVDGTARLRLEWLLGEASPSLLPYNSIGHAPRSPDQPCGLDNHSRTSSKPLLRFDRPVPRFARISGKPSKVPNTHPVSCCGYSDRAEPPNEHGNLHEMQANEALSSAGSSRSEELSKLLKGARSPDEDGDNSSGGEKDDEFELGRLGARTERTPAPLGALVERFPRRVLPVPLNQRPAFLVHLPRKDNLPVLPVPLNRKDNLRGLRLPFDRKFDEYETGPTASALLPIDDTIDGYAPGLVYIAKHILLHGWEHFHDYGWRILPSFAQMFHMTPPTQVGSHIMREVPDDLVQPSCTKPPSGYDVISMGLEDMITHAGTSQEAINIVVTGLDSESPMCM